MKNLYTITFDSDSTEDKSSNQQIFPASKSSSNAPNPNARFRHQCRHPRTKVTTINLSEESKKQSCSSLMDSCTYSSTEIIYDDSDEKSDEQNSNKIEAKIEKMVKSNENLDSHDFSGNTETKQKFRRHLKSNCKPLNFAENQNADSKQKKEKTEKPANNDSNQNDTKATEKVDSNDNETNKTVQTTKNNTKSDKTVQTAEMNTNNETIQTAKNSTKSDETVQTAKNNAKSDETNEDENDSNRNEISNNNDNDNQHNKETYQFKITRKTRAKKILNKKSSFSFSDSSNNCFFEAKPEKGSHSIINIFGGSHYEQLSTQTPNELKSVNNSTNGQLGVVICSPEMDSFSLRISNQYGKEMMSVRINSRKCKNSSSSVFADQKGASSKLNKNFDLNGNVRLLKVNFFINGMNNDMKLQNIESYGKPLDFGQRSALQSTKNFILVDAFQTEMIAIRKTEKNSLCVDFQSSIPPICAFTIGLIAFLYKA